MTKIFVIALCAVLGGLIVRAAELSNADKQFLEGYEKVRSALAADDLAAAKTAAGLLGQEGAPLSKSTSLTEARKAFEKLSDKAQHVASGQSGYYIVTCPMLKKDWVQVSDTISNPYYGKQMLSCGEIKK